MDWGMDKVEQWNKEVVFALLQMQKGSLRLDLIENN